MKIYGGLFDLDSKLVRKKELDNIINDVSFWSNASREAIMKENNFLNDLINSVMYIKNKINCNILFLDDELDDELLSLINIEYVELKDKVDKLEQELSDIKNKL